MAPKAKRRKINGYKMPAPIPFGFIVKNSQKKSWKIGTSIGKGGFGEIYCCSSVDEEMSSKSKSLSYPFVMKIEPQENGPLFVEMHFYMKAAKKEYIESWMKSKDINILGMPSYIGSGSFEYNKERYRFIVMDRYGEDLWSLFLQNKKHFPISTVLKVGLQMVDVLEYIHDQGYAHCDVKGSNLLLGTQKGTEDQVYLVDFGLASRYTDAEFKPDPKKAHNGTIEYTSRDAHLGVITRRGDMEILGFNLLHWVTSTLPWEDIEDPKIVEEKKKSLMNNIASCSKKSIPSAPKVIIEYLQYVNKLQHNQVPDYDFCRNLFKNELNKLGIPTCGKLSFKDDKQSQDFMQKPAKVSNKRNAKKLDATSKQVPSDNEPLLTPNKKVRNPKEKGTSWKDCVTAKASNVFKAGEYVATNIKPLKRQKKD